MDIEEAHTPHKAHTGHRWVDVMLGLAAIIVSGISLSVAVHHGHTMEKLVEANSFPNLEVDQAITDMAAIGSGSSFSVSIDNTGVGPGRVESLELWWNDRPITNSQEFINAVAGTSKGGRLQAQVEGGSITGRLIGANRSSTFFKISTQEGSSAQIQPLKAAGALATRLCYCSVFGECYVTDSRVENARPRHVERCEVPATRYRENLTAPSSPE